MPELLDVSALVWGPIENWVLASAFGACGKFGHFCPDFGAKLPSLAPFKALISPDFVARGVWLRREFFFGWGEVGSSAPLALSPLPKKKFGGYHETLPLV